ncbi:putative outer membrane starch-binding protein [Mucilaginibacter yixingensis]|uniref:Putative outer membrane starch-binding protein n=1 Tax=Mucilaginibacter yixingensis TaxID=1295612 RepID=A0A2T5J8L5_9SPHI|nr:RagB/SusD family nutrient uptake outer membrane protein [Mucilaginibacter yixingensis]PTQ95782.1 putative outer membrane starch-binding protein [Mucilaginibacter yixingensis]
MKKIATYITGLALCLSLSQCKKSFLDATSPSNLDDQFVTSTTTETFKTLSWCYANYRQNCVMGTYRWNDPIGSDAETYPEQGSTNNINAIGRSDLLPIDAQSGGFNALYSTAARAIKIAQIIAAKPQYQADVAAGKTTDWTQLYGEAITIKALCYFDLIKHFGDVPYGYENTYTDNYTITSRFTIYDNLISDLKKVEANMYPLGSGGITAERCSRTYADALIGQLAMFSGGYQTIRTDIAGLYGNVAFTNKGTQANGCVYARRNDYLNYYTLAETWLQNAITNKGTAHLLTADTRAASVANNPFQLVFQSFMDLKVGDESVFELGNYQGGSPATSSEYAYAFGRPSEGGTATAAPPKVFDALRIIPTVYYGDFIKADKRRDVTVAVTGSNGDGNERMISFVPGNKTTGGLAINKWDENRMSPPYTTTSRQSGINWTMLRLADVILMLAETKAEQGKTDAVGLVNQIRERAFGSAKYDIGALSGQALKDAVAQERKLELMGEGTRRWDMIRNGTYSERAMAVRQDMQNMYNGLRANGYYTFPNGNTISNYIWIKAVTLTNPLTYDCTDTTNLATYPAWRGQYNYSTIAGLKVVGTTHNLSIQGMYRYIDPAGPEAIALQAAGYVKTNWGIDIVNNYATYQTNILSGITSATDAPRIYWPIPSSTVAQSNGQVTNGYGLANK